MWEQDRYQQGGFDENDPRGAVIGEVDAAPRGLADEAKADRAAGRPTYGTRGYADTEAFDRS